MKRKKPNHYYTKDNRCAKCGLLKGHIQLFKIYPCTEIFKPFIKEKYQRDLPKETTNDS